MLTRCPHSSSNAASVTAASRLSSTTSTRRGGAVAEAFAGFAGAGAPSRAGSDTVKVVPRPGPGLSTSISPSWSSTSRRTSVRPIPSPPCCRVRASSPWTNGSKMRQRISGAMPTPLSLTRTNACPSRDSTSSRMSPPSGVYFTALNTRFDTIWASRVRSAFPPGPSLGPARSRRGRGAADDDPGDEQHEHRDEAGVERAPRRLLGLDQVGAGEAVDPFSDQLLDGSAAPREAGLGVAQLVGAIEHLTRLIPELLERRPDAFDGVLLVFV